MKVAFDTDRCVRCGICVSVCPAGFLVQATDEDVPTCRSSTNAQCIECGQCEAVCPPNAVKVAYQQPVHESLNLNKSPLDPEALSSHLQMRRSIRHFEDTLVSRELFAKVFDAVRYSPTGMNAQPLSWIVVSGRKQVQELVAECIAWMRKAAKVPQMASWVGILNSLITNWERGEDAICRGAPHLILAHAKQDSVVAPTDATIALTHLEILLPAYGIGTCWAGYLQMVLQNSPQIATSLGIPSDHRSLGALLLGYPKYKIQRIPRRPESRVTYKF